MTNDGSRLYAWQVQEPDGRWSLVGAIVPGLGHMPLISRSSDIARKTAGIARDHARQTNQELRLARFDLAEVMEG
jgi:hypothetical protein